MVGLFQVIPVALLRFWSFHSLAHFFFFTYVPDMMPKIWICIPFQNGSTVCLAVLWKPREEISGQGDTVTGIGGHPPYLLLC